MKARFLDANVLLRHFTGDHPVHSPQATALIQRIERGQETVETSPLVIFETIFTLQSTYKVPRRKISNALSQVLKFRALHIPAKILFLRALDLYAKPNTDFTDAYNVVAMEALDIEEIYSFDTDFDSFANVKRIAPGKEVSKHA